MPTYARAKSTDKTHTHALKIMYERDDDFGLPEPHYNVRLFLYIYHYRLPVLSRQLGQVYSPHRYVCCV